MKTRRGRMAPLMSALACSLLLSFCSGRPAEQPAKDSSPAPTPAATPSTPVPAADAHLQGNTDDRQAQAGSPTFAPEQATGAVKGMPASTNTVPIVAVANYFTEFPGIDLTVLKPRQKERFLQRVNSELCTCGCKNDTLARCYVNDARCPVVKGMVQKVFEESKAAK